MYKRNDLIEMTLYVYNNCFNVHDTKIKYEIIAIYRLTGCSNMHETICINQLTTTTQTI